VVGQTECGPVCTVEPFSYRTLQHQEHPMQYHIVHCSGIQRAPMREE
jgi:hypothetical protein